MVAENNNERYQSIHDFLVKLVTGWRRLFFIGIGANLVVFFVSMSLVQPYFAISVPGWGNQFFSFDIELYTDFNDLYSQWVQQFMAGTWSYSPTTTGYPYPPLFILTLVTFALLHGPNWVMALPLESFNLATGYLVFKLALRLTTDERRSATAMLLYFLNPFTLIYGSYALLNPAPFVFFVVLAFYLVMQQRGGWAMVSLGIATMFKQPALIFVPLLIIAILKTRPAPALSTKILNFLKPTLIYILTILAVSAPFLILNAQVYIEKIFLFQIGLPLQSLTQTVPSNYPVPFTAFFVWVGTPSLLIQGIAEMLFGYALLGGCFGVIYLKFLFLRSPAIGGSNENPEARPQVDFITSEGLFAALVLVVCMQLFFPHGSYKYYLMLLVPFLSLFYDYRDLNLKHAGESKSPAFHWRFIAPLILSWVIFWVDRNLYFLILLVWLVFLLVMRRRGYPVEEQLRTKTDNAISFYVLLATILYSLIFAFFILPFILALISQVQQSLGIITG